MMTNTRDRFSAEVRARAVRMVLDHEGEHPSRWAAISSIAAKIGCTAQMLDEWVKKADEDGDVRAVIPPAEAEARHYATLEAPAMAAGLKRNGLG